MHKLRHIQPPKNFSRYNFRNQFFQPEIRVFPIPLSYVCPRSKTFIILYYIIFLILQLCLSIYLSIYLSICLSIHLFIHPPVYQKVQGYINYRIKQDSSVDDQNRKISTLKEFDESCECKILSTIQLRIKNKECKQ